MHISIKGIKNLIFLALAISGADISAQQSWTKMLPGIGSFSSPRVADLNDDFVGDIILGAGRAEFLACDSAVIALDGKTGDLLWNVSARDQILGSATLKDITSDGIPEVFISSRSAELIAINGKTGEVIWRFIAPESEKKEWFNFYNPQFIPDQNEDGREDILVSNGGDVLAEAHDPNRATGQLVILDSQNGQVISRAPMPDGKEIYMSVAVFPGRSPKFKNVVFGTGGETLAGNFYVCSISEIRSGDLSGAIKLDSSVTKGFVGPAAWVDINNDGIHDIVANAFDGSLLAFDGLSHQALWKVEVPGTEAYSSPAIGNFNKDLIPDFFVSYSQGVWPELSWGKQIMVNGRNGDIEYVDSLGFYQMTSAVVADLNGDGQDEVVLPINTQVLNELQATFFHNNTVAIEFTEKIAVELGLQNEGSSISSTPWIGDLDNNGFLDIVYLHGTNPKQGTLKTVLVIIGPLFWLVAFFLWRYYNSGLGPGLRSKVWALRTAVLFFILFILSIISYFTADRLGITGPSGIEVTAIDIKVVYPIDRIFTILNGLFLALTIFFYFADRNVKRDDLVN